MQKISGILASSPRLQSVDMKDAAPVRPGTPLFGRPEGVSSLRAAAVPQMEVPTTAQRSVGIQMDQMDWRSRDQHKAAIVQEMSNRFFMKNDKPVVQQEVDVTNGAGAYAGGMPVGLVAVESRPTGFKSDDLTVPRSSVRPDMTFDDVEDETTELQQPEGLYPKGSFIDRTV
ncbi:MAG: hypothetical protein V4760_13370 [Bdellovibrionota bacterium]